MPPADLARRIHAIQNTAEVIAQSLREMISEAELKPGQPLIQERIAEMFQVSRVPVRDALQLLIGMGVAVNIPRRARLPLHGWDCRITSTIPINAAPMAASRSTRSARLPQRASAPGAAAGS